MVPRSEVVDPTEVQIFHVYNRCVRRAFLCGFDDLTGTDYSHRKDWLQNRFENLVGIFAFDLVTFSIMSNHFHLVLRSRPDIVAGWSDDEVVRRNLQLQGKTWFRADGTERNSTAAEIARILSDPVEVLRIRRKLADLSFFMSYFDEHIAKKSNLEDGVTGAFWEGTFGCELISNEESLLACMAYVDLNPIRAMLAESLEESDHTGAFERVHELRQQLTIGETELEISEERMEADDEKFEEVQPGAVALEISEERMEADEADEADEANSNVIPPISMLDWERKNQPNIGWLAPIEIAPTGTGIDLDPSGRRPSRKGFLPISLLKYLEVVEWAGRQMRPDKRGSVPEPLPPIFERLGFDSTGFLESMMHFAEHDKYFTATERQGRPEQFTHDRRETAVTA